MNVQYFGRETPENTIYQQASAQNTWISPPARFERSYGNRLVKERAQVTRYFISGIARTQHQQHLVFGRKREGEAAGVLGEVQRQKGDPHRVLPDFAQRARSAASTVTPVALGAGSATAWPSSNPMKRSQASDAASPEAKEFRLW